MSVIGIRRLFCKSAAVIAQQPSRHAAAACGNTLQANRDMFFKKLEGHAAVNAVQFLWSTPLAAELPQFYSVCKRPNPESWRLPDSGTVTLYVYGKRPFLDPFEVRTNATAADGGSIFYLWCGADASQAIAIVLNQMRKASML